MSHVSEMPYFYFPGTWGWESWMCNESALSMCVMGLQLALLGTTDGITAAPVLGGCWLLLSYWWGISCPERCCFRSHVQEQRFEFLLAALEKICWKLWFCGYIFNMWKHSSGFDIPGVCFMFHLQVKLVVRFELYMPTKEALEQLPGSCKPPDSSTPAHWLGRGAQTRWVPEMLFRGRMFCISAESCLMF